MKQYAHVIYIRTKFVGYWTSPYNAVVAMDSRYDNQYSEIVMDWLVDNPIYFITAREMRKCLQNSDLFLKEIMFPLDVERWNKLQCKLMHITHWEKYTCKNSNIEKLIYDTDGYIVNIHKAF